MDQTIISALRKRGVSEDNLTWLSGQPDPETAIYEACEDELSFVAGMLVPEAWAEYARVGQTALAEYERVRQTAWAEYERVRQPALAEYQRVRQTALAEYQRVRQPAWAEYERVRQTAWAEYARVEQTARLTLLSAMLRALGLPDPPSSEPATPPTAPIEKCICSFEHLEAGTHDHSCPLFAPTAPAAEKE